MKLRKLAHEVEQEYYLVPRLILFSLIGHKYSNYDNIKP